MKLLLTGGTGFFGKALLRHLANAEPTSFDVRLDNADLPGASIMLLSRDPARFQSTHPEFNELPGLCFHRGDIQDRDSLPWEHSFTHVMHAATDSTFGPQLTPLKRYHQIHQGTINILDLAVATGARRFLLTSSGGIYGPQPPELEAFPEDWPGAPPLSQPATAYSQAKRAAEHLCALYREAHGLETVIARCFAFVGPDLPLDVHFAIGNFIRDALTNEAITVAGDGTPLRTYLDQRDLAHWLWTLLLEGRDGDTYNVGSDQVVSIAELAHLVRDLLAPEKPVRILGSPQPAAARNRYVPDISKSQRLHGLKVSVPLGEAIRDATQGLQAS
ncbi:MAG: NAD-dependent epimerase/dehydratase family protein [Cyanobium sp.]